MIPAGRVNQKSFEVLFQEVCMYMLDDHRVSSEHFITAIGHFLQYLYTNHLNVDADLMDVKLMNEYALGFASYVYDNEVDVSRPPLRRGGLAKEDWGSIKFGLRARYWMSGWRSTVKGGKRTRESPSYPSSE